MATKKKPDRNCPACGSKSNQCLEKFSEAEWQVVECDDCAFVYLKNPPGYEALVDDFAWEKTSADETSRRLQTRKIGARLSQASRWRLHLLGMTKRNLEQNFQNGNALDIGCGNGGRLLATGAVPHGIEISRELCKAADKKMRTKGGYCVHAPAVEGIRQFKASYFDGILMHSFLEHEEQPAELLSQASRVLKRNGRVYVRVPNFNSLNRMFMGKKWCGFRYPDHVNYFTVDKLKKMAARYGFGFKLVNPLSIHVNDNIKALLIKL